MTPEKLLVPFISKGKQVSPIVFRNDTRTENCNRESNLGPMGIGYAIGASSMLLTASGHWKESARSHVTTLQ